MPGSPERIEAVEGPNSSSVRALTVNDVLNRIRSRRRSALDARIADLAAPFADPLERRVLEFMVRYVVAAKQGRPEEAADLMTAHLAALRSAPTPTETPGAADGGGAEASERLADAEKRVDNLVAALASARRQMWEQSQRADAADERRVALEQGAVHPALAIDIVEHRQKAYETGWRDGYAEGAAKAVAQPLAAEGVA